MKVVDCFTYLLIAGIFSSTIAQVQARSRRESPQRSLNETNEYDIMSGLDRLVEEFVKPECEKNGGPLAYENYLQSNKNRSECVHSVMERFKSETLDTNSTRTTIEDVFAKMCSKVPDITNCFEIGRSSAHIACFGTENNTNIHIPVNIFNSLVNFMCADNARRIIDFIKNDGPKCWTSRKEDLENCNHQLWNKVFDPKSEVLKQSSIGIEACTMFQNFQHCYVKSLRKCETEMPSKLVDSLFNLALEETPCEDLLVPSSAHVNLLSTTAVMGIMVSMRLV